ncbi:uncharacterized protein [Nicotiana tomentosiformis]|uniref:uncharacterized protein n=1 Tax=Nicotiana tomentosiformis TaxID=4098 RepID=UPI00388C7E7D
MEQFIIIATRDILPATTPSIPESWNFALENTESHFRAPFVASSQKSSISGIPPPAISTPSTASSAPDSPALPKRMEDVRSPRSPDHGNIENTFPAPIRNPDDKRRVTLSVSNEFYILFKPVGVANYLMPLASNKDQQKMEALSAECLINNIMLFSAQANLLASEGLQKMIQAKEELASERDRIAAERDQLAERLQALEARLVTMGELESMLEKSEQEKIIHNQEAAQLHEELEELKAKWVELQDAVTVAAELEYASMEQINNLKASLCSKIEEATAEEKRARMEQRFKKVMEQNSEHARTNTDLCRTYGIMRDENEQLQSKIKKLRSKLQDQEDSFLLEKTYVIYHMRRKTLEEAK